MLASRSGTDPVAARGGVQIGVGVVGNGASVVIGGVASVAIGGGGGGGGVGFGHGHHGGFGRAHSSHNHLHHASATACSRFSAVAPASP